MRRIHLQDRFPCTLTQRADTDEFAGEPKKGLVFVQGQASDEDAPKRRMDLGKDKGMKLHEETIPEEFRLHLSPELIIFAYHIMPISIISH